MSRIGLFVLLAALAAFPQDAGEARTYELKSRLRAGQRYTASNTVSFSVTTTIRQGDRTETFTESVQRTERFVDQVLRAGTNGVLEIDRTYLRLYTKARDEKTGRPSVYQSPMQGRRVKITENRRRRDVELDGRGTVDPMVRRTAGMELDWRDIFPEDAMAPGDSWEADASALGRRLSAYLDCGNRTKIKIRFEEILERDGARLAKLYVDLLLEGMRDRHLFTKVILAGDVYFDLDLNRVVEVDMTGTMSVGGATIGDGAPRIVKGEGPVSLKSTLKVSALEAAVSAGDDE